MTVKAAVDPFVAVTRLPHRLLPDPRRVITRLFLPGTEERIRKIINRILQLRESEAVNLFEKVVENYCRSHNQYEKVLTEHYAAVKQFLPEGTIISHERQLLIGAYFSMDYAIESAALFNPSMVPAVEQDGLLPGSTRFLMSLRATGEGHVSSIVFRRGVVDANNCISLEPANQITRTLKVVENQYFEKKWFRLKLIEMGAYGDLVDEVLAHLSDRFTLPQLNKSLEQFRISLHDATVFQETSENMVNLARSNYELRIPEDMDPSEAVIFPISENESRGIEDVRLVRFTNDDGSTCYYGTYTAFNGMHIVPQLLEIPDLHTVKIRTCII